MKTTLNREIVIPADTVASSGISKVVFTERTYEVNIGIGENHHATLYIGEEALKELRNKNNELTIKTTQHDS